MDRQVLSSLVPLVAIVITFAEYRFDHIEPRWMSPWFWASLITIVLLLIVTQLLRFWKKSPKLPTKPDYSATSIIRSKSSFD